MTSIKNVRIGDFCETGSGSTPSRDQMARYYDGGTIPWVKSGELRESIINATEEHITEAALRETSVKLVPANALLVAMYGATVGRLGILGMQATTNQAVCHIVPDPNQADVTYLFRALETKVGEMLSRTVGGAQPNINQGIVKDLRVPLPPLEEQRHIAAILDQAETLRTQRRTALALLDSLTQSLFLDMFGDPVANPKGWQLEKLGKLTSKMGSGSTPSGGDAAYKTEGISLIRSLNVHDGNFKYKNLAYIDEVQAAKLSNVQVAEGDVLLNITGASVARVCRAPADVLPARVNQHVMIVRPKAALNGVFLERMLLSETMKRALLQIGGAGATREAITKAQAEELLVPLPPLPLQQTFATRIASIEALKATHRRALAALDALFASLQQRAFTGAL